MVMAETKVIRNDGPVCPLPSGISIVIPVYDSADVLPALFERLQRAAPSFDEPFELILVNDGSRDGSWSVILRLCESCPWVRGFCLMRNYGQHNALLCGIRAARFDTIVTMDDDLQHPPEELPKLLDKLGDGFDVVYGSPESHPHGFYRNLASIITKIALQSAMGAESARHVSVYRVFRTDLRRAFDTHQSPYVSLDVLLTWGTTKFGAVKCDTTYVERSVWLYGRKTYPTCS